MKNFIKSCLWILLSVFGTQGFAQTSNMGQLSLAPANTAAVTGNYYNNMGDLNIPISSPAENNLLTASDTAFLSGILTIRFPSAFIPTSAQSFTIITANRVSGVFDNVVFPSGYTGNVLYNPGTVVLSNFRRTSVSLTLSFSKTDAGCAGSATGSLSITAVNGGTPPYTYMLGTVMPPGTSNTFNNLKAGSYRVTVTDAVGRIGAVDIVIGQNAPLNANFSTSGATCSNNANGSITVTSVNGGVSPYQYRFGTAGSYSNNATFSGLRGGTYRIFFRDATGCENSSLVNVSAPPPVTLSITKTDETCTNKKDGTITATGANGVAPYQYSIGTTGIFTSNNTFTGLRPATYRVIARDNNGCTSNPAIVTINASTLPCSGGAMLLKDNSFITKEAEGFAVKLSPNPTTSTFRLQVASPISEMINLRVLNATGVVVYNANIRPKQTVTFGERLPSGIYVIELQQNETVKTIKALKL